MVTHIVFLVSVVLANIRKNRQYFLFLAFCLLFMFSALRYQYGNDYITYYENYNLIKISGTSPYGSQTAFELLNKITPNFFVMIAVISFFELFVIYRFISTNVSANYRGIAVFLILVNPYVFLISLSALRQTIALMIFVIAIRFSYQRRPIPYFLLILLASLFHASALILLPVYFAANDKPVSRLQITIFTGVILVLLLNSGALAQTAEYFLHIFDNGNYAYYYDQGRENSLRATLLTGIYFVCIALNIPKLKGKAVMHSKLYLIGLSLGVLAYRMSMLTRLQQYFDFFAAASIPTIMEITSEKFSIREMPLETFINSVLLALMFIIYLLRYYSFFANPMWESFASYHTIFEALA